jgi:DNA-binding response OmpR family regulator
MKRILVIEDEDALREALVAHLGAQGYEVDEAFTAEVGLERVVEHPPNIILLDIFTRSLHASVFMRQLREMAEPLNTIPVIILTNLDDTETRARLEAYGISHYFIKSNTSLAEISTAIENVLGGRTNA